MSKSILKSGVRIIRPSEYEWLREGAKILENRTKSDAGKRKQKQYVKKAKAAVHYEKWPALV